MSNEPKEVSHMSPQIKSAVRNEHVEAYLEGKLDLIPQHLLEAVRERAELRKPPAPLPPRQKKPTEEVLE